jgi:hypothetical protein
LSYGCVTVPQSGYTGYSIGLKNVTDNAFTTFLFSTGTTGSHSTATLFSGKTYRFEGAFTTTIGLIFPVNPLILEGLRLTITKF